MRADGKQEEKKSSRLEAPTEPIEHPVRAPAIFSPTQAYTQPARAKVSNIRGRSLSLVLAFCLSLILLLSDGYSEASVYHIKGICSYKDKFYKPGDSFRRGCDKCFCHDFGVYCFAPMKPTSWPRKCRRIRTKCGYSVIYKENPKMECRAYSWIG